MSSDAVKSDPPAEGEPGSEPTRRQGMRRSTALQMLFVLALIAIALVGLCQVSGMAKRVFPAARGPTPTQTQVPTNTPQPTFPPTLTPVPTATLTPVPQIAVGGVVVVRGTAGEKLRMRAAPGVAHDVVASLDDGTRLKVLDGPQAADGYTWWRAQTSAGAVGWVAADWLAPVAQ